VKIQPQWVVTPGKQTTNKQKTTNNKQTNNKQTTFIVKLHEYISDS
jgi:hypothetical protein